MSEFPVTLTDAAITKIAELAHAEGLELPILRVAVEGGGCGGFQYALGFEDEPRDDDARSEQGGVLLVVDPFSAPYLKGSTVDFLNGLNESGFKVDNPNAVSSCGCGSSFTAEGVDDAAGCGSSCH